MIGRRATAGLTLLCALAFCPFAAQSAWAQVGTPATNTTGVTCVKGAGNLDFEDAHCDKQVTPGTGEYGHVSIENGKTTEIEVNSEKTANKTTESATSLVKANVFGALVEVSCQTTTTAGASSASWIENVETEGKHTIKGTIAGRIQNCTVLKPAKCRITEPIEAIGEFQGVENLNPGGKAMGGEFEGDGPGGAYASVQFTNKGAESCALNGKTVSITGTAITTGGTVSQTEQSRGATSVSEAGNEMQTLKIGSSTVQVIGTGTTRMSGGGNPISTTTVT